MKRGKRKPSKSTKNSYRHQTKQENIIVSVISSVFMIFVIVFLANACSKTNPQNQISQTEKTLTVTESVSKQVTETATTTEPPTEPPTLPPTEPPTPAPTEPPAPVVEEPQPVSFEYWVNTDSGKFHYSNCRTIKNEDDPHWDRRWCDRQELINEGYSPCGVCEP